MGVTLTGESRLGSRGGDMMETREEFDIRRSLRDWIAKVAKDRLVLYQGPEGADIEARAKAEADQVLRFFSNKAGQLVLEEIGKALYFAYDLFNTNEESDFGYVLATFGINNEGYSAATTTMGYAP